MIDETFGDMLFYPESEIPEAFPSPEELKYKVIISTKPPKEYLIADNDGKKGNGSQKEILEVSGEEQVSDDNNKVLFLHI